MLAGTCPAVELQACHQLQPQCCCQEGTGLACVTPSTFSCVRSSSSRSGGSAGDSHSRHADFATPQGLDPLQAQADLLAGTACSSVHRTSEERSCAMLLSRQRGLPDRECPTVSQATCSAHLCCMVIRLSHTWGADWPHASKSCGGSSAGHEPGSCWQSQVSSTRPPVHGGP